VAQGIADRFHGARRRFREGCYKRGFVKRIWRRSTRPSSARPAAGGSIATTTRPSTYWGGQGGSRP